MELDGKTETAALAFGRLEMRDVAACAKIAETAPDTWSFDDLAAAVRDETRRAFVAREAHGAPVAFAVFCVALGGGTADLQLVAVSPERRKKGVAGMLLRHCFSAQAREGIGQVLLELRCSNTAAARLYASLGFKELARRPGMYAHPREDGLLLGRGIGQFDGMKEETE